MSGQSIGDSRIFRVTHSAPILVAAADRARAGWQRWTDSAGLPLVGQQGVVVGGRIEAMVTAMAEVGVPHRVLDAAPGLIPASARGPFLVDASGGVIQAAATGT